MYLFIKRTLFNTSLSIYFAANIYMIFTNELKYCLFFYTNYKQILPKVAEKRLGLR